MEIQKNTLFGKRINQNEDESWNYTFDRYGKIFIQEVGHHSPTIEQLNAHGWMNRVDLECDPTTHKMIPDSWTDDGNEIVQNTITLTPEEIIELTKIEKEKKIRLYSEATQQRLDKTSNEYGYDNIVNACGYASAENPYQTESLAFVSWRGNVWAHVYQALADVEAGKRAEPTIEDLIAELPVFGE